MRGLLSYIIYTVWGVNTAMHVVSAQLDYCYSTDDTPNRNYATVTTYEQVLLHANSTHVNATDIEGCEPTVFYLLGRHSSRYTDSEQIQLMTDILPSFQSYLAENPGLLCEEDLAAIGAWEMRMENSDALKQSETGWQEYRDIGSRYKESFPDLLDVSYDNKWFQFVHSDSSSLRTRDSARAFCEGVFGSYDGIEMEQLEKESDWLIHYYDNCDLYLQRVDENVPRLEEFLYGEEMNSVIQRVNNRTGLLSADTVDTNLETLELLYKSCMYEYVVYRDSPWCMTFTSEDLEILEYNEDLKFYWNEAFPFAINYEQTCELMKDIVKYLRIEYSVLFANETENRVVTRFGHTPNINTMLARLGLFEDNRNLTLDLEDNINRDWRTSYYTPMAAQIVFVRYACFESEDLIAVYVDEMPVTLPVAGCRNGVCPISALQSEWLPITNTCDINQICLTN